jgi:hypothetical protein
MTRTRPCLLVGECPPDSRSILPSDNHKCRVHGNASDKLSPPRLGVHSCPEPKSTSFLEQKPQTVVNVGDSTNLRGCEPYQAAPQDPAVASTRLTIEVVATDSGCAALYDRHVSANGNEWRHAKAAGAVVGSASRRVEEVGGSRRPTTAS